MIVLFRRIFIFSLAIMTSNYALAAKIYSPRVEYGETELELRTEVTNNTQNKSDENKTQTKLEIGRGFTPHWMSELVAEFEQTNGSTKASSLEWENIFQLTEPGEYPIDLGIILETEKALISGEPNEVVAGLLLEKELNNFTATANINVEKQFGDNHATDIAKVFNGRLLWRYQSTLQPALETFLEKEKKQAGPMIYGVLNLANHKKLKYNAGVLLGLNNDSPDQVWRVNLEYEF